VNKLKEATISLNDCLACSGCITSAESILISQQSTSEVATTIDHQLSLPPHERSRLVVSLSPQSRASISAYYNLSMQSVYLKLHYFFTQVFPFEAVFDTNIAREIALVEGAREFQSRYIAKQNGVPNAVLPVITAACPGWICYAEKTHHAILPYLSSIRSPQQVMGSLIKALYARRWGIPADKVWHLSVMPCFDKKLEASREDFAENGVRDVDCVITTAELVKMIGERGISFPQLPESQNLSELETRMTSHPGSSSGGYLHHLMTVSARNLFGLDIDLAEARGVQIRTVRNNDMVEYTLEENGQVKLRMARCNGFRNIQNLVRKLEGKGSKVVKKKGKEDHGWDYVEVMACPSGCINGGGQLPTPSAEKTYTPKEWVQLVEETYQTQMVELPSEERVEALYRDWFGEFREEGRKRCIETGYRGVEFTVANPLLLGSRW
jgi:iron only hydrogenase large subunit-like protein